MTEFASIISEKWNISEPVALEICEHFEKGDTLFYCIDYCPIISVELDAFNLSTIYDFLKETSSLLPKKKRVTNALSKAGALTDVMKNRIKLCVNSVELDDILLPYRTNPRSRAQVAVLSRSNPDANITSMESEAGQDFIKYAVDDLRRMSSGMK